MASPGSEIKWGSPSGPQRRPCLAYVANRLSVLSMVAFKARAGALSGSYCRNAVHIPFQDQRAFGTTNLHDNCVPETRTFFKRFCNVLTSVFCLLANCLLSAQGVRPEMSARAASTEPKPIAAASAVAAKTVWIGLLDSCDCAEQLTERNVCVLLLGRAAFTGLNEDLEVRSLVCACNRKDNVLAPYIAPVT